MDKQTFLNWLLDKFDVPDNVFEYEICKYNKGLHENIDYSKLQDYVNENCKTRPGYIELNRCATMNKYFIKKEPRCYALKHFDYIKSTSCKGTMNDLDDSLKEKIREFLKPYDKKAIFDK